MNDMNILDDERMLIDLGYTPNFKYKHLGEDLLTEICMKLDVTHSELEKRIFFTKLLEDYAVEFGIYVSNGLAVILKNHLCAFDCCGKVVGTYDMSKKTISNFETNYKINHHKHEIEELKEQLIT